jgi:transposase
VDSELAAETLSDPVVAHMMTIPDVDAIAAISILAAVGDFSRFADGRHVGGRRCHARLRGWLPIR